MDTEGKYCIRKFVLFLEANKMFTGEVELMLQKEKVELANIEGVILDSM